MSIQTSQQDRDFGSSDVGGDLENETTSAAAQRGQGLFVSAQKSPGRFQEQRKIAPIDSIVIASTESRMRRRLAKQLQTLAIRLTVTRQSNGARVKTPNSQRAALAVPAIPPGSIKPPALATIPASAAPMAVENS